ncbi:2OG-Fe dioxygenase family protein [Pseudomonas sp. CBR-F]
MIYRSSNMTGGINFIGHPEIRNMLFEDARASQIWAEFTLSEPLDSFAVHDPKVSHYISPIKKLDDASPGVCERCIVLVDFSPTIQRI